MSARGSLEMAAVLIRTTYAPKGPTAYVITHRAMPYLCRINDQKSAMCIFEKKRYARIVAEVFESYYVMHKEWPKIHQIIDTYTRHNDELSMLEVLEMDVSTLSYTCAKYNIDACIVHDVTTSARKMVVKYTYVESNPTPEMSVEMLNDLWTQE